MVTACQPVKNRFLPYHADIERVISYRARDDTLSTCVRKSGSRPAIGTSIQMLTFRVRLNYPWETHQVKVAFFCQTLLTDKDTALVDDVSATGNHTLLRIAQPVSLGLLGSLDRFDLILCPINQKLVLFAMGILLWDNTWE